MSWNQDRIMYDIGKWGVPRDQTACPGCGHQYGRYNRKVCITCEECEKCCRCSSKKKKLMLSEDAVQIILEERW